MRLGSSRRGPVIRPITATATASGRRSEIVLAAGPATTSLYGAGASSATESSDLLHAPDDVARGDGLLGLPQFSHGLLIT
jgi:hypothetical protein